MLPQILRKRKAEQKVVDFYKQKAIKVTDQELLNRSAALLATFKDLSEFNIKEITSAGYSPMIITVILKE